MNANRFWQSAAVLALLGALTSVQAFTNPPIQVAQGIEYMCGGKSNAEAAFMQTVSPRWAATLEFAISQGRRGDFPGEIQVVVRERYTGRPLMSTSTQAPVMLARLDPGAYEIEATLGGISLRQPLVVFNGMASKAVFVWPSNVDFAAMGGPSPRPERQASVLIGD